MPFHRIVCVYQKREGMKRDKELKYAVCLKCDFNSHNIFIKETQAQYLTDSEH